MEGWKCFICGEQVIWQADFSFEGYGIEDREGIVHTFACPKCGAEYDVFCQTDREDESE